MLTVVLVNALAILSGKKANREEQSYTYIVPQSNISQALAT